MYIDIADGEFPTSAPVPLVQNITSVWTITSECNMQTTTAQIILKEKFTCITYYLKNYNS